MKIIFPIVVLFFFGQSCTSELELDESGDFRIWEIDSNVIGELFKMGLYQGQKIGGLEELHRLNSQNFVKTNLSEVPKIIDHEKEGYLVSTETGIVYHLVLKKGDRIKIPPEVLSY